MKMMKWYMKGLKSRASKKLSAYDRASYGAAT